MCVYMCVHVFEIADIFIELMKVAMVIILYVCMYVCNCNCVSAAALLNPHCSVATTLLPI